MEETSTEAVVERVEPQRPLTELLEDWLGEGPTVRLLAGWADVLVQTLVIVVVAWIAVRLAKRIIRRAVRRRQQPVSQEGAAARMRRGLSFSDPDIAVSSVRRAQRTQALGALAESVTKAVIWVIAFLTILGTTFGISLAPLIAGAGILGIALGFGAQGLVRDFLSGVFMLGEDQFGVGDVIDVGDATGTVEGISLRTTRLRDVEGTLWHFPNGEIMRVGNKSQQWSRALLDIGVAYGTDIDLAAHIIDRVAHDLAEDPDYRDELLATPDVWGVQNLGPDSVDIRLVIKTQPGSQWAVAREMRRRIKLAFDAAGIEIPFPQRTVWMRTEQAVALGDGETPAFGEGADGTSGGDSTDRARNAARGRGE
ncbi:MAG: mechanosensitive ion channel family protein [Miltoncostaeaceae bacterium]